MKTFLLVISLAIASGFAPAPSHTRWVTSQNAGKINDTVDLESPKVVTNEALAPGSKKVYCRCWKSKTFPYCDGGHVKHNEEFGDNVGPLIVSVPK
mmetsp:Transcript_5777/g.10921  ORF Transcript_5777/g.10921 Transcript_5777/m.10921 type:complete len:96 (-) Transcript_5777:102-389(-)